MELMITLLLLGLVITFVKMFWFNVTKDPIQNEDKKFDYLKKKFDYLIGSKIEISWSSGLLISNKKLKFETSEILVKRPKKIEKDEWEVLMTINHPNFDKMFGDGKGVSDYVKIFSISNSGLDRVINNDEDFIGTIRLPKYTLNERDILSSDLIKN